MLFNILPWRKNLSFAKRKTNLFKKVLNKNRLNVCRFKKKLYLCNAFEEIQSSKHFGEMAEWSIAAVLKTVVLRGTGGSNPSLSAINAENQQIIKQTPNFTPKNVKLGVFILFKTNHIRSENNLIKNRTNEKNNQFIFRKISYLCSK